MKNKKIIFMGTPIIAAKHLKLLFEKKYNIVAVFSQPPRKKSRGMRTQESAVHKLALEKKINFYCPNSFDDITLKQINLLEPDLIIVMAYGKILPVNLLNLPKYGCINIHVSLLPRWRGAAPIEYALLNGDKETGVSIIKLEKKLDSGPIILQKKITISDDIYKDKLESILTDLGCNSLIEVLPYIFENKTKMLIQNEKLATYASKFTPEERKINFNQSSGKVYNHIRAHGPYPGSWFVYKGDRIKIITAKKGLLKGTPSKILNGFFEIGCKEGSILPILVQKEGKQIISIKEFLKGYNFKIGDKINA